MLDQIITLAKWKKTAMITLVLLALTVGFWLVPYNLGDDWDTYHVATLRALSGSPLYGNPINQINYYSNPPWVIAALIPLGVLPTKLGWSILAILTLVCLLFLARRFDLSPLKYCMLALSPPAIYTILHGQIDVLVLAAFLLPGEWMPVLALAKPQVSIAALFATDLHKWKRTLAVTAVVLALSFVIFGNWPDQLIHQPTPFIYGAHNYFGGIWPMLIPVGVGLVLLGLRNKDMRYIMAASPFFSPYAAISSLIGVWFAACSALRTWQAAVILIVWWGVSLYHTFL